MTVRLKLALTVFVTGALTALGVAVAMLFAFERFEHESAYRRADAFLGRVTGMYDDLRGQQASNPAEFDAKLRRLVLFEPATQLYLLDGAGTMLASSLEGGAARGRIDLGPVMRAVGQVRPPYVMGDDPQRPGSTAVIAARPLGRPGEPDGAAAAGYLYLVVGDGHLPAGGTALLARALAQPALVAAVGVVALATLLAAWIIAAVTRPLQRLSAAVSAVTRDGLEAPPAAADALGALPRASHDEFGLLAEGFRTMLQRLRAQWEALRRLDHFRREGVSNLSHDLRSPLTATTACLETLQARWADDAARLDDTRLVEVALRNTHNAARLLQSLGELAQLDEPEFKLRTESIDACELLDDIALRFAARASGQGVRLQTEAPSAAPVVEIDVALFERAVANLIDNALKFSRHGDRITLAAQRRDAAVAVSVSDTGSGIEPEDVPRLFDRYYQARRSVAPATGEGGRGLGLAIVKRIAELHGGTVEVVSRLGAGTQVTILLRAG